MGKWGRKHAIYNSAFHPDFVSLSTPHLLFLQTITNKQTGEGGTAGTTTNTSMATGSAHYSQADNPTVVRDAKAAARVDLSSVRRKYKSKYMLLSWGCRMLFVLLP